MKQLNNPANIASFLSSGAAKGPVLQSSVFDKELMTHVDLIEFEVSNHAKVPDDLPFGLLAEIVNQGNMTRSRMQVRVGPGFYTEGGVVWPETVVHEYANDPSLLTALISYQVVPIDAVADSGAGIWDSEVKPLDSRHGLKITRKDPTLFTHQHYVVERPETTPPRFLAAIQATEESHLSFGEASWPVLAPGETLRSAEQVHPLVVQHMTKSQNSGEVTLQGSRSYVEGVKVTVTESLKTGVQTSDTGLQIIESEVQDLGNGKSIKSSIVAPTWPTFKGSKLDGVMQFPIAYTERFVAPPATTNSEPNVEYEPVNQHRSLRREIVIPQAELDSRMDIFPVPLSINLPRVLKSVQVVWNTNAGKGDQNSDWAGSSSGLSYALSCNLSDQSSGSAAAIPEVLIELEDVWTQGVMAEGHLFFMPYPVTTEGILARLGVTKWPVFKPKSHTIVGIGQKIACSVNVGIDASVSGSQTSRSTAAGKTASGQVDVALSNNTIQIPPTIHGQINFIGETYKVIATSASASMSCSGTNFPTVKVDQTIAISAVSKVFPNSFEPTQGGSAIPTSGRYLIDVKVERYKYGYAMVYAEVLDASKLI